MKRFGMAIKLKPGSEAAYRQYHAAVWPEVLKKITECNIKNYSIFFKDNMLFSYFEYYGSKVEEDWAKMAADPQDPGMVGGHDANARTAPFERRR